MRAVAVAGLLLTMSFAVPSAAQAGCNLIFFAAYECGGQETTQQAITFNTPATTFVTTLPGFQVVTGDPVALSMTGQGGASYVDGNAARLSGRDIGLNLAVADVPASPYQATIVISTAGAISGGVAGIQTVNNGTGSTQIMTTGPIQGGTYGIRAENNLNTSGDLIVNVAGVTGGTGISLVNRTNTGAVNLTATGHVLGTLGDGIAIAAPGDPTRVSVTVATVEGAQNGIVATAGYGGPSSHIGGGFIAITASGLVRGVAGDGINADNSQALGGGGGMSIDVAEVSGGRHGIVARTNGTVITPFLDAQMIITARGPVTGHGGDGIFAEHLWDAAVSIDAQAPVSGLGGAGIRVLAPTNAHGVTVRATSVTGAAEGVVVENGGSGATLITTTGLVQGGTYGVRAESSNNTAGDLTVNVASVTGGTGISLYNRTNSSAVSLTATGHVLGTSGDGIAIAAPGDPTRVSVTVATVEGAQNGIVATAGYGGPSSHIGGGFIAITASGLVRGVAGDGINADNSQALGGGGGMSIDVAEVSGGRHGIVARTNGTVITPFLDAQMIITARGPVTGHGGDGIFAEHLWDAAVSIDAQAPVSGLGGAGIRVLAPTNAHGVSVKATSVTGAAEGVVVENGGSGATLITTTGLVQGGTCGVRAESSNNTAGDLTVNVASVTGGTGISLYNRTSSSAVNLTATGHVLGTSGDGIAIAAPGDSRRVSVTVATVEGAQNGIVATAGYGGPSSHIGGGFIGITASGLVRGLAGDGINADNSQALGAGGGMTIDVAEVSGGRHGIVARSNGTVISGLLDSRIAITARGPVTGHGGDGIFAEHLWDAAVSIDAQGAVSGLGGAGIRVLAPTNAHGVTVRAASVTGATEGVVVENGGSGATEIITSGRVSGAAAGVRASQTGTGDTTVTAAGPVVGTAGGSSGVWVDHAATAGKITVDVTDAAGDVAIRASNAGIGATAITTRGLVEGVGAAIVATAPGGQPVVIVNEASGTIRNASQLSAALAVQATGATVDLANRGTTIGRVELSGGAVQMSNAGRWDTTGGTSQFGGAGLLVNQAGAMLIAGNRADLAQTTTLSGLASFENRGVVSLADGAAGDVLHVAAATRFAGGSSISVDLGRGLTVDRLETSATLTLDAGATLNVASVTGLMPGRYMVMTSAGGRLGTFGGVTGLSSTAFLSITDAYDLNNVYLDVVQARSFVSAGATPNQIAVGRALDGLPVTGPLYGPVASLPTVAAARAAFDALSGEIHATARTILIEDSRFVRDAAIDRLRGAFDGVAASRAPVVMSYVESRSVAAPANTDRFALWAQGFGAWGNRAGDGNAAATRRDLAGFFIGGDGLVAEAIRIGLYSGYSRTSFRVGARSSSGASDNYHVGLYGGGQWGALGLRAGAALSWHDLTTNRTVAFAGFGDMPRAAYTARTTQIFGEAGYRFDLATAIGARAAVEPFAGIAHVGFASDRFGEGGGAAALTGAGRSQSVTFTSVGLRGSAAFTLGGGFDVTARATLGWRHAFGSTTSLAVAGLAGGTPFAVAGVPIARNAALVEAGLDMMLSPAATLGLSYGGQFGSGATDQTVKAHLAVHF
ncbi:Extracellular serine protease precursor [bacterium YEK0313]|nr:Extracellular serine protease precursor [bacterium YEK0313]